MNTRERVVAGVAIIAVIVGAAGIAAALAERGPGGHAHMGGGPAQGQHGMAGMHVDSEFAYLAQMIPHHEEAIAAAKTLQQGTNRQAMRRFAGDIVRAQSAEVARMRRWLAAWYPGRDTDVGYQPMMRDLKGLTGDDLDRAFLEDMIPHHMMAVMMSQQVLRGGLVEHDPVTPFARKISDVQRSEIRMMRSWLRSWFGVRGGGMGPGMHGGMGPGMHGG